MTSTPEHVPVLQSPSHQVRHNLLDGPERNVLVRLPACLPKSKGQVISHAQKLPKINRCIITQTQPSCFFDCVFNASLIVRRHHQFNLFPLCHSLQNRRDTSIVRGVGGLQVGQDGVRVSHLARSLSLEVHVGAPYLQERRQVAISQSVRQRESVPSIHPSIQSSRTDQEFQLTYPTQRSINFPLTHATCQPVGLFRSLLSPHTHHEPTRQTFDRSTR
mmetsp:Transcript_14101/g.28278  ORF Transcript_14101/g.28278 Transcript_14101/m.28278 type:complete len:218 (-) Transcript_14101:212-865(-)